MSTEYRNMRAYEYAELLKKNNDGLALKAYIKTFGCQQNEADSERIAGLLAECGYTVTDSFADAHLVIFNTCAVRSLAEAKALSLLGTLKARAIEYPELIVGVVGCMGGVKETVNLIKRKFHYVSFTLGAGEMYKIPELVYRSAVLKSRSFIDSEDGIVVEDIPVVRGSHYKAYVSIMYGCNNFCSYCIVPYTRGRERSRNSEDILRECRELVASGVKEIMLLGQNVNSYRSDMDFPSLLSAVADIPGEFTVRFMTSHPKDVSDALIEAMALHREKIAPTFHLPLQSGSDRILRDMNRTYTRERFIAIAEELKRRVPGIALTTDVIVGYPSESEEDFLDTIDVLRRVRFDAVYAFLYSKREGTRAATRTDTVPEEIKHDRITRLLSMQDAISAELNREYVGRELSVLTESFDSKNGKFSGRSPSGKLVHFDSESATVGEYSKVLINKIGAYDLIGTEKK